MGWPTFGWSRADVIIISIKQHCVSRETSAVSHLVNTIISFLLHFSSRSLFFVLQKKEKKFTASDNHSAQTRKENKGENLKEKWGGGEKRFMETETPVGWTERARENYRGTKKKSARAAHKLYTVKRGAVRLLPKYAQRTGMQHGALGTQNKDSTVSGSLSPVLPHPHIINWKIPDICCNPPPPPIPLAAAGTD